MAEYKENIDIVDETDINPSIIGDDPSEVPTLDDPENAVDPERQTAETAAKVQQSQIDDDIVTAVLLIRNRAGDVLPVTSLDNLKMDHQANAHEVFRMCADVQDQISAVRIVGELAQIFDHINARSLKQVAELLGVKMDNNIKQAKP